MNKPKFNIDAHAYWLLCEGQQVEVDGQKIQLTIVDEAKKTIDLHKDSWGVLNDGSQRFQDTVVKWMNEKKNEAFDGDAMGYYYGIDEDGDAIASSPDCFTHILTIDEFCALAYPEKEEGSELVGKWVRYNFSNYRNESEFNAWCQVERVEEKNPSYTNYTNFVIIPSKDARFTKEEYSDVCFDLANPLDYNPETLVGKYYQGNQIESIYFDDDEAMIPRFKLNNGLAVLCSIVTPSDVTDTPPVKSLKYEDCFERVEPNWYVTYDLNAFESIRYYKNYLPTERQAKQLAATIKLMTIMHDANGGEWVPRKGESRYLVSYDSQSEEVLFLFYPYTFNSPIYFRDYETAKRAYEANKEIFHDYFGIGGENE